MASALYDKGREKFLTGEISWTEDDIKCVLIDTDEYTVDLDAHEFLSDIPEDARTATSANFQSKTATAGVADAADITLTAVTGQQSESVVIYKDSGSEATSPLIAYIESGTGLPITPSGSDVLISWSNTTNKIFKL